MNLFLTVKAKQRFIVLGGETFKLKWLKRWGFYRVIWFGIIAKFGMHSNNALGMEWFFTD